MKMRYILLCPVLVVSIIALAALFRYGHSNVRTLDGGAYRVEVHRDTFPLWRMPGGSSDAHGYCKVSSVNGKYRASYYYLEMVWFADDLKESDIVVEGDEICVALPTFAPLSQNFWKLVGFGE